jgi:hypothetical protein
MKIITEKQLRTAAKSMGVEIRRRKGNNWQEWGMSGATKTWLYLGSSVEQAVEALNERGIDVIGALNEIA